MPKRPVVLTAALFVVVVFAAAGFSHLFREAAQWTLDHVFGSHDATEAARRTSDVVVGLAIAATVVLAALVGTMVHRRRGDRSGIEALAAAAGGENRPISVGATAARGAATWTMAATMVSVGRESAIVEAGGAFGATVARRTGGRGHTMAAVGLTAAFTAAYHAPLSAIAYVEQHLGVRRSRRATRFVVIAALAAHLVSVKLMGGHQIFPRADGSRWTVLGEGLVALVPTVLVVRLFTEIRSRTSGGRALPRTGWSRWVAVLVLAGVSGVVVAVWPLAAGNGMEALRHSATTASWAVVGALLVGKAVGTLATLATGAPGGVISPTLAVGGGVAMAIALIAERLGADPPGWSSLIGGLVAAVVVGLRTTFGAAVMVPELLGDYGLIPVAAVLAVSAWVVNRGLDVLIRRGAGRRDEILDEDA